MSSGHVSESGQRVPAFRQGTVQNVSFDGSVQSSAFSDNPRRFVVMLQPDEDCYVLFGSSPTATSSNGTRLPSGSITFWEVIAEEKVAAIKDSTAGTLNITELK